ncbi:hypothetical protein ASE04_20820 [Rhizobium sp. Root708]|uniref:hypothetical protein n=1 Tax=Rhizobium sp. Root708 TaxID=1736592 RepID=UPI0006FAF653|nr:hypothetical protein [Rhizobium sp. Root708]KRB61952.1 hypothetical protein ASE04_20820 [Rhizobium sp. Root708]
MIEAACIKTNLPNANFHISATIGTASPLSDADIFHQYGKTFGVLRAGGTANQMNIIDFCYALLTMALRML